MPGYHTFTPDIMPLRRAASLRPGENVPLFAERPIREDFVRRKIPREGSFDAFDPSGIRCFEPTKPHLDSGVRLALTEARTTDDRAGARWKRALITDGPADEEEDDVEKERIHLPVPIRIHNNR